jgi:hypothetical protein
MGFGIKLIRSLGYISFSLFLFGFKAASGNDLIPMFV